MAATSESAKRTVARMKAVDPDYYRKIGQVGGKSPKTRPSGFKAMSREKVSAAGRKGGTVSRRGEHNKLNDQDRKIALLRLKARQTEPTAYELHTGGNA